MSDQPAPPADQPEPPGTGDPVIDGALNDLDGLSDEPLAAHHDRLARAHEVLQGSLDRSDPAGSS